MLAAVAGIMTWITLHELLPAAFAHAGREGTIVSFFTGACRCTIDRLDVDVSRLCCMLAETHRDSAVARRCSWRCCNAVILCPQAWHSCRPTSSCWTTTLATAINRQLDEHGHAHRIVLVQFRLSLRCKAARMQRYVTANVLASTCLH